MELSTWHSLAGLWVNTLWVSSSSMSLCAHDLLTLLITIYKCMIKITSQKVSNHSSHQNCVHMVNLLVEHTHTHTHKGASSSLHTWSKVASWEWGPVSSKRSQRRIAWEKEWLLLDLGNSTLWQPKELCQQEETELLCKARTYAKTNK